MQHSFLHKNIAAAITRCLYVLFAFQFVLGAQDPVPAATQSEMQKWIATTDEGWQAAFKRDVTEAYENQVNKLKLQYLTLLEEAVARRVRRATSTVRSHCAVSRSVSARRNFSLSRTRRAIQS